MNKKYLALVGGLVSLLAINVYQGIENGKLEREITQKIQRYEQRIQFLISVADPKLLEESIASYSLSMIGGFPMGFASNRFVAGMGLEEDFEKFIRERKGLEAEEPTF